ncbi:MAG TPA: 3-hydroxyacyl-CoA dehydrogenase family protein, partial [Candidatus Nitrosotenuis sp.]|nr:3-hydroxyacyl-CoA dehydrogenase family protein [Candidatus Nitrosotenuis sp.]
AAWLVTNKASDVAELEKAAQLGLGLKKPIFETAQEFGIKNIVNELNDLVKKHGAFYEPDPLILAMQ